LTTGLRAYLGGLAVLSFAYGAWFVAVRFGGTYLFGVRIGEIREIYYGLVLFLWLSPALAAFLVSYFSPQKKMLLGMSMAFVAAIYAIVINTVPQLLGDAVDFPGIQGAVILFTITSVYSGVGCAAGGFCGYMLAKRRAAKIQGMR